MDIFQIFLTSSPIARSAESFLMALNNHSCFVLMTIFINLVPTMHYARSYYFVWKSISTRCSQQILKNKRAHCGNCFVTIALNLLTKFL